MYQCKHELRVSRCSNLSSQADLLYEHLSPHLQRVFQAASEWVASCWLTTLPIAEHGFALPKGEFRDALCLRFGWQPVKLPQTCVCGKYFSVEHAFSCPCGRFPSIHRNEVWDLIASLLSEVSCDVGVEPALQPLDHEPLHYATANREDGACLDVVARGFWGQNRQRAFFDIVASNCQGAIVFMCRRSGELMMNEFWRWREHAFAS